ncbi:MAG TPA: hypothetical protein VJZ94_02410, partial [Candidatus Paceibacterota bacterium]|nr:hypothetical protein [Candidatus Paceibacterota bacterium]
ASVAFQVALIPTPSQRGSSAQLIGEAQITGDDTWTIQTISSVDGSLDTTLPDDSSSQGKAIVQ